MRRGLEQFRRTYSGADSHHFVFKRGERVYERPHVNRRALQPGEVHAVIGTEIQDSHVRPVNGAALAATSTAWKSACDCLSGSAPLKAARSCSALASSEKQDST